MSSGVLEFLKILGAFIGAVIGAVGAISYKEHLDRRRLKEKELQTRWLPLLRSAKELKEKLDEVIGIYRNPADHWNDYQDHGRPLPLTARDFHELYLLDINAEPIENVQELKIDPGERRKNEEAVQSVRSRIHELNRATVLLYRTATYLAYAQRVRTELLHGELEISGEKKEEVTALLWNVRKELNGPSGAGMIDDLQDLIGESVWREDGAVISYYEFRERILSAAGWEQFTELLRFYVHFHKKLDSEVKSTGEALALLCKALEKQPARDLPTGLRNRFRVMAFPGVALGGGAVKFYKSRTAPVAEPLAPVVSITSANAGHDPARVA
jgi:hypothetical protein